MKRNIFILFLFCIFINELRATIIETPNLDRFEQALETIDSNALVLFDVDETLIVSKDLILRPCARNAFKKYEEDIFQSEDVSIVGQNQEGAIGLILSKIEYEVVDPQVIALIYSLQRREIKTIAFTKMMIGAFGAISSMEDWRLDHLKKHGFDFSAAFSQFEEIHIDDATGDGKSSLFKRGLLCANRQAKGPVLVAFLEKIDWKPSKVLFLDNRRDYLQSVKTALANTDIEFIGFHYTDVENRPCKINEHVAKIQFEHFAKTSQWLNDTEALELLSNDR